MGRLKGSMVRATERLPKDKLVDANTIIGDKKSYSRSLPRLMKHDADGWPIHDTFHEIVLRSSAQCFPMIKFDKALRYHYEGRQCLQYLQDSSQQIIDRIFNKGMVKSDIHDAPLIGATLSSASFVSPWASSTALSSNQLPGQY